MAGTVSTGSHDMRLDPVSLQLFVSVVETGTIAGAGEREHMAASAVSKRISELEALLDTQLLARTNKGVVPTAAGIGLLNLSRGALHRLDDIVVQMREYASGTRGLVRVFANISAITQFLPGDLASFMAQFPDVRIELEESRSNRIAQAVREGKADIGIVVEGTDLQGLQSFDYRSDRLVAVVPRGHALRQRKADFAELIKHDFVGLDSNAAMMRLLADAAAALGEPLRLRVQVSSFEAVCKLVQAGMGIGVLPEGAAKDFTKVIGLRLIRIADSWAQRRMLIAVRDISGLPLVGRKLVEQLVFSARPVGKKMAGASQS